VREDRTATTIYDCPMNPLSTVRDTLSTVAATAAGTAGKTKSVVAGGIGSLTKKLPIPLLSSGASESEQPTTQGPAKSAATAKAEKPEAAEVVEIDIEVVEVDIEVGTGGIDIEVVDVVEVVEVVESIETDGDEPQGSSPSLSELSTNDAVVATLERLTGPVSVEAIHTELMQLGRDEPVGHIEAALDILAKQKRVIRHGPAMWEVAHTQH